MGKTHSTKMGNCHVCLDVNEQAVITTCTGSKSIANGPGCSCAGCCVEIEKRGALVLSKDEYVIIHDEGTGDKRVEDGRPKGKEVWMNEMDRLIEGPKKAVNLTIDQYLVYENTADGTRSVVQGEMMFVPAPHQCHQPCRMHPLGGHRACHQAQPGRLHMCRQPRKAGKGTWKAYVRGTR